MVLNEFLEPFLVIHGTFLGSWTCKEPFWEPFSPRVLNTGQKGFQVAFFSKSVQDTGALTSLKQMGGKGGGGNRYSFSGNWLP